MAKQNIKKGDTIIVLSGKDKGKKGKVLEVFPKDETLIAERMNVAKRHQRPSRNFQGGIIEKAKPMYLSKVMLVCPRCSEPSRIRRKDGARICGSCEEIVDKVK